MESLGINIGYLALSLLCFTGFVVAMAGGVYLAARYAYNKSAQFDESELLMILAVTEEGITIPKSALLGAEKIELRRTNTKLILHPVIEE